MTSLGRVNSRLLSIIWIKLFLTTLRAHCSKLIGYLLDCICWKELILIWFLRRSGSYSLGCSLLLFKIKLCYQLGLASKGKRCSTHFVVQFQKSQNLSISTTHNLKLGTNQMTHKNLTLHQQANYQTSKKFF